MKLFIIGYMGCGKSSIGRPLSGLMNYTFIDLDLYIEEKASLTIPEIFRLHGEDYFRRLERQFLIELCDSSENIVISTGGGTPCFDNNMDIMNKHGITIYIDLEQGILCSRLKCSKKKRPLIEGMNDEELAAFIAQSIEIREPFYKKSQIDVTGKNIKAIDIFLLINGYNEKIL